jgi:DNA polymerase (family X)
MLEEAGLRARAAAQLQTLEIGERVDVVGEIRDGHGHDLEAEAARVRAKPRSAVRPVERRERIGRRDPERVRRAVERLDERDPSGGRRGEQRAKIVRNDTGQVGVHDQDRAGLGIRERRRHGRPLPLARILGDRRAEVERDCGGLVVGRHDARSTHRHRGRENVAEHRERQRTPGPTGGVQACLALHPGEGNDDSRHGQETSRVDNNEIAQTLEAYAGLLDLAGAGYYSVRAYRRAAELVRETRAPVADLVREGRVRELHGIGRGIEERLRELVTTGRLLELEDLEREVEPQLVALGRLVGLGPQRMVDLGKALGIRTADELRSAAAEGRLQEAPGIGPETERKILAGLGRDRSRRRGLTINRAHALSASIAEELDGEIAGETRRWCDVVHELVVVSSAPDPVPVLDRFASLAAVVAIVERHAARAIGVTVDGVPVELVVAAPAWYGTELLRATGSPEYVASLGPLPDAATELELYAKFGLPWCPPELREGPLAGDPPALVEIAEIRGDLHCHTTWSDGKASVEEMAIAARSLGYEYVAICDHTPNVHVVPGLDADALRRQAEEIAEVNERLTPFRVLRGTECDIRRDGTLDLPEDVLAELDWVQLSLHAGQREDADRLTQKVIEAIRHPAVRCLSHPKGRIINHRPPNALQLERVIEVALEEGVALETNGLPDRLDLCDVDVRLAVEAGVRIVCSTDAHSVRGLGNMQLAVATARRGWATAADVLNTGSLDAVLALRRR